MAINLFNWNEFRKGYREGEVEDQQDARFLLDQQRGELANRAMSDQIAFEDQMRPLRIQQATQNNQLGALNLLDATRRNEVSAAAQPGALALTDTQNRFRTALAGTLDIPTLARQAGQRQVLSGEVALNDLGTVLRQQPARAALADAQISGATANAAYEAGRLPLLQQQDALTGAQLASEASLLPARTQLTADQIATGALTTRLTGQQAAANAALLPAATEARASEIQTRLRHLAQQTADYSRRSELVRLSDIISNPTEIQRLAAEQGMDPVTYLDQLNEVMAQQAVGLNLSSGAGPVDMSMLTPRSREDAMMRSLLMAGRLQQQRPQVINVRAPAGARAGAAGAPNPVLGGTPSAAAGGGTSASTPEEQRARDETEFLRSLFPSAQQIESSAAQRSAVASVPKPPPLPDNVRPDDVKAIARDTNWGGFTTEDLAAVVQNGKARNYSDAQIAAAGQELYKRRLAAMRERGSK